jgi:ligand-binding sensor domain-containing protein
MIWIGTDGLGLVNYNPVTRTIKKYLNSPADSLSISTNNILFLMADKEGALWIGTNGKGLCRFNTETAKFTSFPFINNDNTQKANGVLDDAQPLCLYLDNEGILWIGTDKGSLNRFDTKTGKFSSYLDYKSGFFCLPSVYEDSHKRFWAGSYPSGLFLVDKKTGALINYREKDGLINNSVITITEDKEGNLWMRTPRGLSKFNVETKRFTNYPMEIGLPYGIDISLFKDRNGVLYVPTDNGLISFDPARMNESAIAPACGS